MIYVIVAIAVVAPLVLRTIRPAPAAVAVQEGLDEGVALETSDEEEKVR